MKPLHTILFVAVTVLSVAANAGAAGLSLTNGNFDVDPPLGGADDPEGAPSGWFTHYTIAQSWSDFRFGNSGNGGWNNNGLAFGQNYLGPNFDPGPEDGYYYTSLGVFGGELSATVSGFGYNRINGNAAGGFDVGFYYSRGGAFSGGNGLDVAGSATLLGTLFVDISALTGTTARNQAFSLSVQFAGSGISAGDRIWLRLGDGPDNGDLNSFDEPIIDNLQFAAVVPEPSSMLLALAGAGAGIGWAVVRRRRRTLR